MFNVYVVRRSFRDFLVVLGLSQAAAASPGLGRSRPLRDRADSVSLLGAMAPAERLGAESLETAARPPNPPATPVPLDGGLGLLALAGGAYATRRLLKLHMVGMVALLTSASVVAQPSTFEATPSCSPNPPTFVPISPIINYPVGYFYNSTCTPVYVRRYNGGVSLSQSFVQGTQSVSWRFEPGYRYCVSLQQTSPELQCMSGGTTSVTVASIFIYAPLPDRTQFNLLISPLRWIFNNFILDAKSAPRHRTPRLGSMGVRG